MKAETRERTEYMSDSSALAQMRVGISKLKAEAVDMNLRLGTAENLIAAKFREGREGRGSLIVVDSSDDDE